MKHLLSWSILIAFLLLVQWLWGWPQILSPWTKMQPANAILGVILLFSSYSIRTWRIHDYFRPAVSWWPALRLVLAHNFLNNALPARLGELSFPLLMKRYFGIGYLHSSPVLLWFRLLDLHAVLMLAAGTWLLSRSFSAILSLAMLLAMSVPIVVYLLRAPLDAWLRGRYAADDDKRIAKLTRLLSEALAQLPTTVGQFSRSLLLTWLNWLVKLLVLAWFLGLFIDLPLVLLVTATVAGELTSILPVHAPGGFGTYEAGLLVVLAPAIQATDAISWESATAAAINTHLFLFGASALGFLISRLLPTGEVKSS